ncbi:hypothetical protein ZHAS_00001059 [Anopheles sinensis]|uniref:Uncharacterized protein n=1 Tax=Anopheles sinensis TaxID=74873 RepID=A0A084VAZ8_ANOSI|nr:hypothetical protein ZHAS_00001059 [Anopheles sinensis]
MVLPLRAPLPQQRLLGRMTNVDSQHSKHTRAVVVTLGCVHKTSLGKTTDAIDRDKIRLI